MEESLSERLAAARKAVGLTQEEAGYQIGTDRKTISGYETGYRQPSNDVLVKFAKTYHVSTDYLLGISDKRVIDGSGLNEDEYKAFSELIVAMSEKNAKLKKQV